MLSIKKGGFYKSDTILFNLVISIIAVISVARTYMTKKDNKVNKSNNIIDFNSIIYICNFPVFE